jgi:WD40 repeat protein
MNASIIKSPIMIVAIALLCGCTSVAVQPSSESASDPGTSLPAAGTISRSNVEQIVLLHTLSGHSKRILDVAFTAQGELIASSSQDLKIKLWDVASGQEIHTFQMGSVDRADIDISTDGNMLASAEAIWDLESMQEIHSFGRGSPIPASVAFSPDGSLLALSPFDQETQLWGVASGQPVYTFPEQEEKRTKQIEFSPDGALLAGGLMDGTIRLWDTENGDLSAILKYPGETDTHDIAFSPDGGFLASGGRVPAVILWNVATGKVVRTLSVRDCVLSVAFSPDGTILAAAAGAEKAILLWDVETGDLLRTLPHNDQSMAIAFSPDGRLLASGCFDSQVYLWGLPTHH